MIYYTQQKLPTNQLIQLALKDYLNQNIEYQISKTNSGKPYFINHPELNFSLSHSKNYFIITFFHKNIGIDLQYKEPIEKNKIKKIAQKFFHPIEINEINEDITRFYHIFCAKESYVKYCGTGINESFNQFSISNPIMIQYQNWITWEAEKIYFYETIFEKEYQLCICTQEKLDIDSITLTKIKNS